MAIEYAEMQGFPIGIWNSGHFDGHRRLRVPWGSVSALLTQLEDTAWPYADGPNACAPHKAVIKPYPLCRQRGSGSMAQYDYAVVDLFYTTRAYKRISLGINVRERTSPYIQYNRLKPNGKLFWDSGCSSDKKVQNGDGPPLIWAGMKYHLTYAGLRGAPDGAWNYIKCVNVNTVNSYTLGKSFAPETLLYNGAEVEALFSLGKSPRWNATYNFLYWPFGHNKYYNPQTQLYEPMYYKTGDSSSEEFKPYTPVIF